MIIFALCINYSLISQQNTSMIISLCILWHCVGFPSWGTGVNHLPPGSIQVHPRKWFLPVPALTCKQTLVLPLLFCEFRAKERWKILSQPVDLPYKKIIRKSLSMSCLQLALSTCEILVCTATYNRYVILQTLQIHPLLLYLFIWHTRVISYQRMYSSPSHALRLYSARAGTPLVPSTAGGSILLYSINIRCCITSDCPLYQAHGKYKRETIGLIPGKLEWIWLEYRAEVCLCQCNWLLCIPPCMQQELDWKMLPLCSAECSFFHSVQCGLVCTRSYMSGGCKNTASPET